MSNAKYWVSRVESARALFNSFKESEYMNGDPAESLRQYKTIVDEEKLETLRLMTLSNMARSIA